MKRRLSLKRIARAYEAGASLEALAACWRVHPDRVKAVLAAHGIRLRLQPRELSLLERFEQKFIPEPTTGCWLWTGAGSFGSHYGKMLGPDGKQWAAHRLSWFLYNGPIPNSLHVLHRCDTPPCVNPGHLFLGTQDDNNKDMFAKGRAYDRNGVNNPRARFTEEQVMSIRTDPRLQHVIAAEYGVSQSRISAIKRYETYANVNQ